MGKDTQPSDEEVVDVGAWSLAYLFDFNHAANASQSLARFDISRQLPALPDHPERVAVSDDEIFTRQLQPSRLLSRSPGRGQYRVVPQDASFGIACQHAVSSAQPFDGALAQISPDLSSRQETLMRKVDLLAVAVDLRFLLGFVQAVLLTPPVPPLLRSVGHLLARGCPQRLIDADVLFFASCVDCLRLLLRPCEGAFRVPGASSTSSTGYRCRPPSGASLGADHVAVV